MNILSISQFIFLMIVLEDSDFTEYATGWIIIAIIFDALFLVDLVAHIVMFGFKRLMSKRGEYVAEFIL